MIDITINISNISKEKIIERRYKDKEGVEKVIKELKVKLIPLKEKKFVTQGKDWKMFKTHFLVEKKDNKEDKDVFIGDGFQFEKVEVQSEIPEYSEESINPEDIPF